MRRSYREAVNYTEKRSGLTFTGKFTSTQSIDLGSPAKTGTTNSFDLQQFGRQVNYGITFDGYLGVPADGFYELRWNQTTERFCRLTAKMSSTMTATTPAKSSPATFLSGRDFTRCNSNMSLRVGWALSGQELKPLEGSALYH